MDTDELRRRATILRARHRGPGLLVLPNAWDVASARAVEDAGFPVVATSSGAVAASLGYEDDDCMPLDEAFGAVARIARAVEVPVTADIEAGYGLDASALAERLLRSGAVGCNLEDTDHRGGGLAGADAQAAFIASVKEAARDAGVDVVVNARVDVFIRSKLPATELMEDGIDRAKRYLDAGADCVYPIVLADDALIARFVEAVEAPVNILAGRGAPPLRRLEGLGVARASLASGLFRTALGAARDRLAALAEEVPPGSS